MGNTCAGIFVLALGMLALFNPGMMWALTEWNNATKGITNSERTPQWEISNTLGAILFIIIGIGLMIVGSSQDDDRKTSYDPISYRPSFGNDPSLNATFDAWSTLNADSRTQSAFNRTRDARLSTPRTRTPTNTRQAPTRTPTPAPDEIGRVTRIIDGDTIEVSIDDRLTWVRYLGINAPPLEAECGTEAADANARLVEGETVWLFRDVNEMDQDQRLLRYVYVGDLFINAELVKQGFASAVNVPPDNQYSQMLENLMRDAQRDQLGCAK